MRIVGIPDEDWESYALPAHKLGYTPSDSPEYPADEIADVLFVLVCIANQTGVNLTQAIEKNFAKKTARDDTRHLNNEKLNSFEQ